MEGGAMNNLQVWWESQNTDLAMLELIIEYLLAWRNGQTPPPYFGRDLLALAYDDQRFIGWGCFLEGGMAKSWLQFSFPLPILPFCWTQVVS
jgi:hypothetical protein